jgi:peroxiredoxin
MHLSCHYFLRALSSLEANMNTTLRICLGFAATFCVAKYAAALNPNDTVDNFRLLDHKGASHELYYLSDMKAVVLMSHGSRCDASTAAASQLKALRDKYRAQGVEFLLIDSNLQDTRDAIAKATDKSGIDLPVLLDETQLIGESLGLKRNGEVFVINPQGWKVAYRGPVTNRGSNYVADAIDSVVAGTPVKTATAKTKGCSIAMPETSRRAHEKISYEKTIAPLLIDNCVVCHRAGGIGPWQMSSYEMVKGFSPMIREVVRTERMPPWHADPHYGVFKNNRALTTEQAKMLVHWVEAGAPRGKGSDPLAELKKTWSEWAMGEPDLVLEVPAFSVPATGVIPYQESYIKNPLGRDVWLKAIDYIPGDRTVVHHILGFSMPPTSGDAQLLQAQTVAKPAGPRPRGPIGSSIGGYVPGAAPFRLPEDTGVLLGKDSNFRFQIHYTPTGKATSDVTRVGLYFQEGTPKYPLRNAVLADPRLKIPANTKAYTASISKVFDRDVLIYSLTPHSHFRGKASNFIAQYPDGTEEVLLSVPKYDFNWQTSYAFTTPKALPKGTKLIHSTTYDNSEQNKANPDHNIEVRWGEQSWEEMLYGNVSYRNVDEVTDAPKPVQVSATP